MDKKLILDALKFHYNLKKDAEFARFLDIPTTTLSSWYSRNTFKIDIIVEKCVDVDLNKLLRNLPKEVLHGSLKLDIKESNDSNNDNSIILKVIDNQTVKIQTLSEEIGRLKAIKSKK